MLTLLSTPSNSVTAIAISFLQIAIIARESESRGPP